MNSQDAFDLTYSTGISNIELEKAIGKDGHCSYYYAYYILKDRFELGEEVISQYWYYSWSYAIDVMKRRFRLGEEVMGKNVYYSWDYFIKVMGYDHE